MIGFGLGREGLAPVIGRVQENGFAGLALDGKDVGALIAAEQDPGVLLRGVELARRHNEPPWMEKCARRLAETDGFEQGQLELAAVLGSLGELEEAETLLCAVPSGQHAQQRYLEALGVLRVKQGRTREAFDCFDRLSGANPYFPAAIVLPTAEEMIQDSPLDCSSAFVEGLAGRYPSHPLIRSLQVRCLAYQGDLEQARELADVSPFDLAKTPLYDRRRLLEARALVLSLAGWNNELFELARDVLAEDPTHWAMYYLAAEAEVFGWRRNDYDGIIARLKAGKSATAEAIAVLCRWEIDNGRIEQAKKLIEKLRPLSASSSLNSTLYLNVCHGSADDAGRAFEECMRCGVLPYGPVIAYGMYLYFYNNQRDSIPAALALLDQHRNGARNNPFFWQLYLRCQIAADKVDEARGSYLELPRGLRTSAKLQPFQMYFDVLDGKDAKATSDWTRFIRVSKHACVNARVGYPDTLALRYQESLGDVLVYTTVYNGMTYIDWFLGHYRALGVDHFFITDNGSDDGTVERLLREPDVSLFSCRDSFAQSAFGVMWINHLMQRFGLGRWCFHVDIDEGFVFPGHDRGRSLKNLLSYLDDRGYGAVVAVEVDMYSELLEDAGADDVFASHCYFDTDYDSIRSEVPPYVIIQGGIRRRMTGLALTMTKTPLIRVSADSRYIECSHNITHLPVADVRTALLHYKFIGDVAARVNEAIDRGEHFAGALAYRRLHAATTKGAWGGSLYSSFSRKYEGASSLEAAGVLYSSAAWEAFRA